MAVHIQAFDGPIGAAVTSVDLSQPMNPVDFEILLDAWNEHSVLVFREQRLKPEHLIDFSRRFGELEIHVLDQYLHKVHKEILVVSNILENDVNVGIPDAGRYWHSDLSYLTEPSRGSILYAIEIPEKDGETLGNTLWTSTAAAYEALPDNERDRLDGLRAQFSLGNRFEKLAKDDTGHTPMKNHQAEKVPTVIHPVVRTHPVTGRKCIYVNEGHTVRILDMPEDEGGELLRTLWAHCTKPEFTYRHQWRVGDVVMWDNVPTQHLAVKDYELPQRRLLHRTTLSGERPF